MAASDDLAWFERGEFWDRVALSQSRPVRAQRQERKPLLLTGHGIRLQVHSGALVVRDGLTRYPQRSTEERYFRGDPDLPSRVVIIGSSGSLTIHVLAWLKEQQIPLLVLNWKGEVVAQIGSGWTCDPKLREAQLWAQRSPAGLTLATGLIRQKLKASLKTLVSMPPSSERSQAEVAINQIEAELGLTAPASAGTLLMLEAEAARMYFRSWRKLELRWVGTNRHPIPLRWRKFGSRRSTADGNPRARHPVNAMLNYGYAMLESQVRESVRLRGLDPSVAFLHASRVGGDGLVFDLMEPFRPVIDDLLLRFFVGKPMHATDFTDESGVISLRPELAKIVSGLAGRLSAVDLVVSETADRLAARLP